MHRDGEITVAAGYGTHEFGAGEAKWFLVWVGVWIVALAALLPSLI